MVENKQDLTKRILVFNNESQHVESLIKFFQDTGYSVTLYTSLSELTEDLSKDSNYGLAIVDPWLYLTPNSEDEKLIKPDLSKYAPSTGALKYVVPELKKQDVPNIIIYSNLDGNSVLDSKLASDTFSEEKLTELKELPWYDSTTFLPSQMLEVVSQYFPDK